MKKVILVTLMALIALTSCVEELSVLEVVAPELHATIEAENLTKTELDADNNICWMQGDQIVAFVGTSLGAKYAIKDEYVGMNAGYFSKAATSASDDLGAGTELDHTVAFYPYSQSVECLKAGNGYAMNVVLPASQTYIHKSFSNGSFPMVAVNEGTDLSFRNVCGAIKLQLKGVQKVASLTISGKNEEKLAGDAIVKAYADEAPTITMGASAKNSVTLNCGNGVQLDENVATEFIISLPPTVFTKGFKVEVKVKDGAQKIIETDKVNKVVRSSILVMPELFLQENVVEPGFNEGDYIDEYGINHGKGVEIDGIIWAPVNCGYHEDRYPWGKLYQWGRSFGQGYDDGDYVDASSPVVLGGVRSYQEASSIVYEDVHFTGDEFYLIRSAMFGSNTMRYYHWVWPLSFDNPCPEGWSMPSINDLTTLAMNQSPWTVHNGVTGYWYSGSSPYSQNVPRVFLPSAGMRTENGVSKDRCSEGYYWSSDIYDIYMVLSANMFNASENESEVVNSMNAYSVRCVRYPRSYAYSYVSDIVLSDTHITMEKYDTKKITATVSLTSTGQGSVRWDSENPEVAVINSSGEIYAVSEGEAVITAKAGRMKVSCSVSVTSRSPHEGDYIDDHGVNHGPGFTFNGTTWAPVNCGYVAPVKDDSGNVTDSGIPYGKYYQWGRKYGYVSNNDVIPGPISLYQGLLKDTDGKRIDCYGDWLETPDDRLWNPSSDSTPVKSEYDPCPDGWMVPTPAMIEVFFNSKEIVSYDGKVLLDNFTFNQGTYWFSSKKDGTNPSALYLEHSEYLFDAMIEIWLGGISKSAGLNVRCVRIPSGTPSLIPVESVFVNKSSLSLQSGGTYVLKAAINPAEATHNVISWSSDDESVAIVDSSGKVTAVGTGTTTIRATAGMKSGKCVVTVS